MEHIEVYVWVCHSFHEEGQIPYLVESKYDENNDDNYGNDNDGNDDSNDNDDDDGYVHVKSSYPIS